MTNCIIAELILVENYSETLQGQRKSKQAKTDACKIACEYFFGEEWSRTVFNKKGNGGIGVKHPIHPHLPTLSPHPFPMDPNLHHDPVGAVNSICKSYGIPTPSYQPYPGLAFRFKVTCVISFMDNNFVSAIFSTVRDAREDCARRILVFLLECGYQPRKREVLESLESAFEVMAIDETVKGRVLCQISYTCHSQQLAVCDYILPSLHCHLVR